MHSERSPVDTLCDGVEMQFIVHPFSLRACPMWGYDGLEPIPQGRELSRVWH